MFLDISFYTILVLFLVVCLILMLLVLIQKGRGGGLSSAFGGGGGHTAFGSKTGDVLTWATSVVFGVFLVLAVGLNLMANGIHTRQTTGVARMTAGATNGEGQSSLPNAPASPEPGITLPENPTPTEPNLGLDRPAPAPAAVGPATAPAAVSTPAVVDVPATAPATTAPAAE